MCHLFTQKFIIFSVHFLDYNSPDLSCNTDEETVKLATEPSIQWTTCALSTNVKRPGRENEHSCPSGTLYFTLLFFALLSPHFHRSHVSYAVKNQSHYRPEVPRGFQKVKVPTLRDNGRGWWQGCQPYAPAAFYPQEILLVHISVRG